MRRSADRYTFAFDVPPDVLWRTVSDTDAVNRDAGLPPVRYTYEPRDGGPAATVAHARFGPLALEWEEPPFHWEAPHRVAVERRFRGPRRCRWSCGSACTGPCIAMRANERLDYFGATVNLAARVAHAAGGGEILITTAVADDARVADMLPDGQRGTLVLRGIPAPVDVVLVRAPAAPAAP